MSEKNITLRNKFVKKINNNIVKLTKDIKLLTRVDESLYDLSGGGMKELKAAIAARDAKYAEQSNLLLGQLTAHTLELQKNIMALNANIDKFTETVKVDNLPNYDNLNAELGKIPGVYNNLITMNSES